MSHVDPYQRPDDWSSRPARDGSEDGGTARYGRHRARHSAVAPDPYAPPEAYGPSDTYAPPDLYAEPDSYAERDPYPVSEPDAAPDPDTERDPYVEQDPYPPADPYAPQGLHTSQTSYATPSPAAESYPPPSATGTDWDQPTAEFQSAAQLQGAEPYDPQTPPPAGPGTGRRRGRRRRKRGFWPSRNGSGDGTPQGTPAQPGDNAPQKKPGGRAGRNLPAAIGVGVTLGALVLTTLFLWKPAFLGVIAAALVVAIWELTRAVGHSGAQPPLVPVLIGGVMMAGLAWYEGPDALCVGLLVTVLATMVWRLGDGPAGYQRDTTAATLVAVYVPFLGGFAALLAEPDDGARRVLVTLAAVVLSDTGGYVAGVFLGRHPMAPSVSPKKSWEGLAGSLVAAGAGGAVLLPLLFDVNLWWGVAFGLAISVVSVLGDLAESMLKRDLGIKDMSTLLPGHGGLMDRLDSILFALPTAYLLLLLLAAP